MVWGFEAWGFGCRVSGLGCRFRVSGLGCRIRVWGVGVKRFGFGNWSLWDRGSGRAFGRSANSLDFRGLMFF